ncbi:MAG TPA: MMPL family transporter [Planctomycetota bacterium]
MRSGSPRSAAAVVGLIALLAVAAAAGRYASGWKPDNRLQVWAGEGALEARALPPELGGDSLILVRAIGLGGGGEASWEFADGLGARLANLSGVAAVVDPFHLPGAATGDTESAAMRLRAAAARPAVRALDLVDPSFDHADFLLTVHPDAGPGELDGLGRGLGSLESDAKAHGLRLVSAGHSLLVAALDAESQRVSRLFAPALALVAGLGLWILLRSFVTALLAVLPAALTAALLQAALRALGLPSNLVLAAAGPLVFVMLVAATLHPLAAYRERRAAAGCGAEEAARIALRERLPAGLLAALTTAAGFGVFLVSPLPPVRELGSAIAVAILIASPLAYLGLRALLAGLAPGGPRHSKRVRRVWRRLAVASIRRRFAVIPAAVLLIVAAGFGVVNLHAGSNPLDYFPEGNPVRAQFLELEGSGVGLSAFEVIARPADGSAWDLEALPAETLAERLAAFPTVTGVFGPEAVLADTRYLFGLGAALAQPEALRRTGRISPDGRWLRWTVRFATDEGEVAERLALRVESDVAAWGAEHGADVRIAGGLLQILELHDQLVETLGLSLGLTVLVTGLLLWIAARTRRAWLAGFLANLVPAATSLLLASLLGYPLDGATVVVAAAVLGLAVDNTLHLLHEGRRRPDAPLRAGLAAFEKVGEAAALSALALALGFSTLALSGFVPIARFGLLAAAGATAALVADLVVLPALWLRPLPRRSSAQRDLGGQ